MSETSESVNVTPETTEPGFTWHPEYAGQSYAQVRRDLAGEIARDQRSYQLAMEGAEASEAGSLVAIVDLERRWSTYEFDWAEYDSDALASRILAFEQLREERKELVDFAEYRASGGMTETATPAPTSSATSLPVMKIGMVILVVLVVIFLVAVVF